MASRESGSSSRPPIEHFCFPPSLSEQVSFGSPAARALSMSFPLRYAFKTSMASARTNTSFSFGILYTSQLCAAILKRSRLVSTQITKSACSANAIELPPTPQKASRITRPVNFWAVSRATTRGVTEYHPSTSIWMPWLYRSKYRYRWAQNWLGIRVGSGFGMPSPQSPSGRSWNRLKCFLGIGFRSDGSRCTTIFPGRADASSSGHAFGLVSSQLTGETSTHRSMDFGGRIESSKSTRLIHRLKPCGDGHENPSGQLRTHSFGLCLRFCLEDRPMVERREKMRRVASGECRKISTAMLRSS